MIGSCRVTRQKKKLNIPVLIMAMFGVLFLLVFCYLPMVGIVIAFKNMDYTLDIWKGLWTSHFSGLASFTAFLRDPNFFNIFVNTLGLNVVQLLVTFPGPILFALLLNEINAQWFKKTVQTVTYFPYFVSWVVFGGIVLSMLSPDGGLINVVLLRLGLVKSAIPFASDPSYFWAIVIISSLIKGLGWGAVIYIAAIAGVDPSIYESGMIDGVNRFQKTMYITLPSISGTIIVMLLLAISGLLSSNFDQIYVLQNPLNLTRSEVLDTYIYKVGISQMRYSFTTAVGLFKSVLAMILLVGGNLLSKKTMGRGLF